MTYTSMMTASKMANKSNDSLTLSTENHDLPRQPLTGIGVFGGTFDPIHIGHIETAKAVIRELNLAELLLIPAHIPPHKTSIATSPRASANQRADMVDLVCQKENRFYCDRTELSRSGHSYTVDTLKQLKNNHSEHSLYFIIGMDSLLTFTTWHKFQDILQLCHLIVNTRPNYPLSKINTATKTLLAKHQVNNLSELQQRDHGCIYFTEPQHYDISSSQIRQRLLANQDCDKLLPPKVIDFINKNQLYR